MSEPNAKVYKDDAGEWRFRIVAANGEIVAVSEGYSRQTDAWRGLEAARRALNDDRSAE